MKDILTIQTRNIVQNFYQALASRELETLCGLFSEQVDWYIPGNEGVAPWLGRRESREEIEDFFHLLWQNIEPVHAQIDHILVEGHFAIASGEFSSKMLKTGKLYSSMFSAQFTIESEKIVRYRLQEDSYGLFKALTLARDKRYSSPFLLFF
ncbi:nuclear transport factor 2 family protein [Pedobacter nutrimenti]|uniref:nuclear transport factor 2 family protein n=1 Tax=Pedobacter nutrimenti TaxID=1241337 RepID=UPI00292EE635|nr:nuclear transport factor 2 family protein [Pedobacter nutrimenti]